MFTKESLISYFKQKISRPLSFRDISASLNLAASERRKFKKILRELVSEGSVIMTRNGLYGPSEEMSLVSGFFEAHKDGYGFVISDKPGERDIFIPTRYTMGAMGNDRVVARVENSRRREGRIIRILQRAHARVAGTFETSRRGFYVRPKSRAIQFDIYIASKDKGKAKDGDNVIVEIVEYPSGNRPPLGKVLKILKKPKTPMDEVEGIIEEFNLPKKFPADIVKEAAKLHAMAQGTESKKRSRKDLRDLPTVTIDGERAKDFDDAVSIRKIDAAYKLWVHIADVGHYVGWDTPIDKEARKRGTSVYFPDRVIPMLPKELSEDLCSLKPNVDRNAFTVEMNFNGNGEMLNAEFYLSIINSNERMTYTSVSKILIDKDAKEISRYGYLVSEFELMGELCNILKARRLKRGSLDFDLPEPEVLLDIQGNPENIIRAERNFAHMIIEEFMIAANEAVAGYLEKLDVPFLYRIHEEPDSLKLEDIMTMVSAAGLGKGKRHMTAADFPKLLLDIQGTPYEDIINNMILRSLKQAKYSPVNIGHFGLASESYCHFTSPIRRYPDLVAHRILCEAIIGKGISDNRIKELQDILPDIAFHSSRMERQSDEAERAVLNAMRAWFMKDRIGEEFEGKVVAVTAYGLKIRLKEFYVEGFLHVSYMTDDFYKYDEKVFALCGVHKKKRYAAGSELRVRIDRVDLQEREIVMGMA
jgi:ribonuclease R